MGGETFPIINPKSCQYLLGLLTLLKPLIQALHFYFLLSSAEEGHHEQREYIPWSHMRIRNKVGGNVFLIVDTFLPFLLSSLSHGETATKLYSTIR